MTKVCILAAGEGTRNSLAKFSHKALLPIQGKPIISLIIDCYPKHTHFIIAIGHNGHLIKDYLKITRPNYKITFVKIKNLKSKNSGPGETLLQCKKYLKSSFISHACDTLIDYKFKNKDFGQTNWIGYDNSLENDNYVFVKNTSKKKEIFSNERNLDKAFIGLAYIKEYEKFWQSLKKINYYSNKFKKKNKSEKQMLDGFYFLSKLKVKKFRWMDTGNDQAYQKVFKKYSKSRNLILPKQNEHIYIEKKKVIKFFYDKDITKKKYNRSKLFDNFLPSSIAINKNFLSYDYFNGHLLVNEKSSIRFEKIIDELFKNFWKKTKLNRIQLNHFYHECNKFYKIKTFDRVDLYLSKKNTYDRFDYINNLKVSDCFSVLDKINWTEIQIGIPGTFHGDTAPNNIVVGKNDFKLIDWRESFGSLALHGDLYYDFSKMYHALLISQLATFSRNFSIIKKKIMLISQ